MLQQLLLSYNPPTSPVHRSPGFIFVKQLKASFKWRHFEPTIILLCVRWYCNGTAGGQRLSTGSTT